MSTRKLSSYFNKQNVATSKPDVGIGESDQSVRARLERKLLARKKEFAFNFPLDDDEGSIQPEATTDSAVDERTSFRFDFHQTEPGLDSSRTELPPLQHRRQLQDFAATSTSAPLSRSDDGGRKEGGNGTAGGTAGKKRQKKKKKKKRKEVSELSIQDLDGLERRDKAGAANSSVKGLGGRIAPLSSVEAATNSLAGPPIAPALPEAYATSRTDMTPAVSSRTTPGVSLSGIPGASRPSPGLTLESWKDPALTDEERRRRRFGCGVRNMAAIERRSDNRRVGLANMSRAVGSHVRPPANGEAVAGSQVESLSKGDTDHRIGEGASTGSSVFSFGFDIGISFNGC